MKAVFFILFAVYSSHAFEWSFNSQQTGVLTQCGGNDITLPWNYTLAPEESIVDFRWHFRRDGSNQEQLVATNIEDQLNVMPDFADHIRYVPLAGLAIKGLSDHDSGNYSVTIIVQDSSGNFQTYSQSAVIKFGGGAGDNSLQLEKNKLENENHVLKDNITLLLGQLAELRRLTNSQLQIIAQLNLTHANLVKNAHCSETHTNPTTTKRITTASTRTAAPTTSTVKATLKTPPATGHRTTPKNRDPQPFDCSNVFETDSGVYNIFPSGHAVSVFCDQVTDGGGWTVFQKRYDGSLDFFKSWSDYGKGFGDPHSEYWLGLDTLHEMTSHKSYVLRIDLQIQNGSEGYSTYSNFKIGTSNEFYTLKFDSFTGGTAGDSLSYHNGMMFTTKDQQHDKDGFSCAVEFHGAWWYNDCYNSNLNGNFKDSSGNGAKWNTFTLETMTKTEMKIRPS